MVIIEENEAINTCEMCGKEPKLTSQVQHLVTKKVTSVVFLKKGNPRLREPGK